MSAQETAGTLRAGIVPGLLPTPGASGQGSGKGQPAKVRGFGQAASLEDPAMATACSCAPLCPLSSLLLAEAAQFKSSFGFTSSERRAWVQNLLTSRAAWPRQSLLEMVLV